MRREKTVDDCAKEFIKTGEKKRCQQIREQMAAAVCGDVAGERKNMAERIYRAWL